MSNQRGFAFDKPQQNHYSAVKFPQAKTSTAKTQRKPLKRIFFITCAKSQCLDAFVEEI